MGFEQINYLGFSYGTFLGAVYADMFPEQTDRLVLDSVREPGPVDPNGVGPVLILNTTGDPTTPLAWAKSLHGQIKNSTLVVAPAQGHIASSQNACAEDTLTAFLMKGALPPDRVFNCPPNA
jgi:pimeloyl-ACP methyl ester carboxylesterase